MNAKSILTLALTAMVVVSCNEREEGWLQINPSLAKGAPIINEVVDPANYNSALTVAQLEQIILVRGDNLTAVDTVHANGVGIPMNRNVQKVNGGLMIKIPYIVPEDGKIDNKLTVGSPLGEAKVPLKVVIPPIVVSGLDCEYVAEGATATVIGNYLDLWGVIKDADIKIGNQTVKVASANKTSATFVIPTGTSVNSAIKLVGYFDEYVCPGGYKDESHIIMNMDTKNTWSGTYVVTNGTNPAPIQGVKDIRFTFNDLENGWLEIAPSNYTSMTQEILNNLDDYELKFEVYTLKDMTNAGVTIMMRGGVDAGVTWRPYEASGKYTTNEQWKTIRLPLSFLAEAGVDAPSKIQYLYVMFDREKKGTVSVCMDNFRIGKKK